MKVAGRHFRTIWVDSDGTTINIIDQTLLPHRFEIMQLNCLGDAVTAIKDMQVRGAPLIGVTAAYGMYLTSKINSDIENLIYSGNKLKGRLSLKDLLTAKARTRVKDIYIPNVDYVHVNLEGEEVAKVMSKYDLEAIPVVNNRKIL